ncbi:hypothetical protein ACN4EE_14730 [Geminocystis sp. CENA526]|uniref:hypothetical protein n=1 Tax=Geminocystis sp. CENA526 TaxID=1355871 RepID=UPI003D6DEA1B
MPTKPNHEEPKTLEDFNKRHLTPTERIILNAFLDYVRYTSEGIKEKDEEVILKKCLEFDSVHDYDKKNGTYNYLEDKGELKKRLENNKQYISRINKVYGVSQCEYIKTEDKRTYTRRTYVRYRLVELCNKFNYRLENDDTKLENIKSENNIKDELKRLEENKSVSYDLLCLLSLFAYNKISKVKKTLISEFFIPEFLPQPIKFGTVSEEDISEEHISKLIKLRLITENNDSYDLSDVIIKYSQKIDKKDNNYRRYTNIIAQYLEKEYQNIECNNMLEDESLKLAFNSFLFYLESEDYPRAWDLLCYSPRYDKFYDHSLFIYARRHGLSDKIISCYEKISEKDKSFYHQIVVSLCLYLTNRFSEAIKVLESLIAEIQKLDTTEDEENNIYYQALLILYKCYFYEDKLETAKAQKTLESIETYLSTIEQSTKNYYDLKINYYLINARINLELGKYQEGYEWCKKSLNLLQNIPLSHEINQKNHLSVFKGKTLSLRGRIQCNLDNKNDKELKRKNDDFAIKDLKEAIECFNTDPHSKTICYVFLLQIYLQTDKSNQEKKEQIDEIKTQYSNNKNYYTSYMNALYFEFEGDLSENEKDKKKWYEKAFKEANKTFLQIKFLIPRLQKKLDSVS